MMNWIETHWTETPTEEQQAGFLCTNCGKGFGGTGLAHIMEKFVYCPYCGAKMEIENEDKNQRRCKEVYENVKRGTGRSLDGSL